MIVLLDTNVVLDVLMDRAPFAESAAQLFSLVESGNITAFLCATTVTTVHYLAHKTVGAQQASQDLRSLMSIFDVAPVNRRVLLSALDLDFKDFKDFEDAVIHEAARLVDAQAIVTRNVKDFKKSELPVYSAEEMVQILGRW